MTWQVKARMRNGRDRVLRLIEEGAKVQLRYKIQKNSKRARNSDQLSGLAYVTTPHQSDLLRLTQTR